MELESHITTLETNLSELNKSHGDLLVFQLLSSNSTEHFEGMTESTTVLDETFHKSIEGNKNLVFNIETIDTISGKGILPGDEKLDFGLKGSECEQMIEKKSKLREDASKVCTNGITQDQIHELCGEIDAKYLKCKGKGGLQAKLHSTEQYSLEKGSIIASAVFDTLCNQVDAAAVEELYDRQYEWKQKGKMFMCRRRTFAM